MTDEDLHAMASEQHNRISRAQLEEAGLSRTAIEHRVEVGRLVRVIEGVFAFPPLIDNDHGTWMTATLASSESYLNRLSAACAWGVLDRRPAYETVVRPGSGGPRVLDGIVVYRSTTLDGETTEVDGIPNHDHAAHSLGSRLLREQQGPGSRDSRVDPPRAHHDARTRDYLGRCQRQKRMLCDWRAPSADTGTSHSREPEAAPRSEP